MVSRRKNFLKKSKQRKEKKRKNQQQKTKKKHQKGKRRVTDLGRAAAPLKAVSKPEILENLIVVVDLEVLVEVKHVLGPIQTPTT
jgi:hypothetical protein